MFIRVRDFHKSRREIKINNNSKYSNKRMYIICTWEKNNQRFNKKTLTSFFFSLFFF